MKKQINPSTLVANISGSLFSAIQMVQFFYITVIAAGKAICHRKSFRDQAISSLLKAGWIGSMLLFIQCQSLPEAEPAVVGTTSTANARLATSVQTITTMDGAVMQVSCTEEVLASGEIIQICMPAIWNGELILYAHGYVSEFEPLRLPQEATAYIPLYTSMGFAFATTSFRENGLAIRTGIDDIVDLRKTFVKQYREPKHTYLTGGSQGGIITTLAIEAYPKLFSGGLSLCGPCGDFQKQINYYGDFRVLFDYFFPGILPGNAVTIPDQLIANWETVYAPMVLQAISLNQVATMKLLQTAEAPYDPTIQETIAQTVLGVLWYSVFTTRDAIRKLGGQPFDNWSKVYAGTGSQAGDAHLNATVQRFSADKFAAKSIEKYYQTSGNLSIPLVTAHTTADPIQLFWHLPLYQVKTVSSGKSSFFTPLPVQRYGHCTFTQAEIAFAFGLLWQKVNSQPLVARLSDSQGKIVRSVTVEER